MKTTISIVFMVAGATFAGEWQRNTFPSTKHVENGFAPGAGWSHTEAVMDISVSPADPNFRAMLENEWTGVYTEDGLNYKPLRMPHIGTPGSSAQSVEFSPHDPDTMYLLVAHNHWNYMDPTQSPAGLWRTTDRGQTWEHLFQPPAGGYEDPGNNPGRTRIIEDPSPLRSNHIYFGSISEGLQRSTDDGATWESVVPELANRRIKTVRAVTNASNETFLYTIAEKKMPRHIFGDDVPLAFWAPPSDYTARWLFNNNLGDASGNGNGLSGSVAGWTTSTIEGYHAARFNGSSPLTSANLTYDRTWARLSVSAWVQTTSNGDQSILSYDPNEYWELGTRAGHILWTIRDSGGAVHEIEGPLVNDGEWYHIGATFDSGTMRLFVDGERVALGDAGNSMLGSGNTVVGVVGAGFTGVLDDVRIYNSRAMNLSMARELYLEDDHKHPVPQGQLWRIRVDASGNIAETVRLHAPLADFHDVEIHPHDPSQGWIIRKAAPFSWPYGGRELYQFSNYGATLTPSTATLDGNNSKTFDVVMVNPGNPDHVFLACAASPNSALRWSMDGGTTWQGLNRKVGDFTPSIDSWIPKDYKNFDTGAKAGEQYIFRGSPFSFVPGDPDKLLWIDQTMGGLMQSDDYGATWRTYASGGPNKDLGQIAVAPSNPDHWAVGLYEHGWSVTTNGGLSWTAESYENNGVLRTLALEAAADGLGFTGARIGQGVAYHPANPDIMVATWTGNSYIMRSTNAGISWTDTGYRNPQRLGVDVFWSRTDPNRVYAGRMRSDDEGVTWVDTGKVVISVCDSDSDLLVGVNGMRNDVTQDLNLYVSTDGGDNWTLLPDPPRETVPGTSRQLTVTTTARTWGTMADALVAIDPGSSSLRILLAGRSGIYEYNEGSNDWTLRNTGLENNSHYNLIEPVPWMGFVAFDPRPGFSHIVYAASQNDNATQGDWSYPNNPNHAYPGGENSDPYYRSTDGGITWEHLQGANYPDAPGGGMIESMTIDSRGRMFAATTEGIYIYTPPVSSNVMSDSPAARVGSTDGITGTQVRLDRFLEAGVYDNGFHAHPVFVFQMSGVTVPADITNANFSVSLINKLNNPSFSTDAHVIRTGADSTILASDYETTTQLLMSGFNEPGDDTGEVYSLDTTGQSTLTTWLQNNWADGEYVFIGLKTDPLTPPTPGANEFYRYSGDASEWGGWDSEWSESKTDARLVISIVNYDPVFTVDPVVMAAATQDVPYTGTIAGHATDIDGDTLTFAKVSGPAWLTVGANGDLSGTPAYADVGLNRFTVEAYDGNGGTTSATLEITVESIASVLIEDSLAARIITSTSSLTPESVQYDSTMDAGTYINGVRTQPVFVFQMTGVTDPADIINARFSVGQSVPGTNPPWSVDAYVIRTAAGPDVLLSDYADGQLLMSNFSVDAGTTNPSLGGTGQSTLTTWLQNNWVEGEYVFIGLQTNPLDTPDTAGTASGADHELFRYGSSYNTGWMEGSSDARLEISAIDHSIAEVVTVDDANAGRVGHGAADPAGWGTSVNTAQVLDAGIYENAYQAHPVFVFRMSGVAAPSNITNANFSVGLVEKVGTFTFDVDAHVIRKDASSTILASDYETTAQSLMSNFSVDTDSTGTVSLDAAGQSTLGTWLKNNWAEDEYVFIGLQTAPLTLPDHSSTRVYRYGGANGDAWSAGATDARLEISVADQSQDFYTLWAQDNGVGAMDEDFDEDGLSNLAEFALKGDPKDPNDKGLTAISTPGGTFAFVHAMLSDPNSGVEYIVEVNDSGDLVLGGWTHAGITVTSGALDADYDLVTNAIPTSASQNFIRLQINEL